MTLRSNILRAASAVVIAAILATVGGFASPSSAATNRVGSAELQAAATKSQSLAATRGVIVTPCCSSADPNLIKFVYSPNNPKVPADFIVIRHSNGLSHHEYAFRASVADLKVGGIASMGWNFRLAWPESIWPDEAAIPFDEYQITKPDSSTFVVQTGRETMDARGLPLMVRRTDIFSVNKGLIIRSEYLDIDDDGPQTAYYEYATSEVNRVFTNAVNAWKNTLFSPANRKLATTLTNAFVNSQKEAQKSGLSVVRSGDLYCLFRGDKPSPCAANTGSGTFSPVSQVSVSQSISRAYPGQPGNTYMKLNLGFGDLTDTFRPMWSKIVGECGAIKYNAPTGTYSLCAATIKLDSKERITTINVKEGIDSESWAFKYMPDKESVKRWAGASTGTKQLARWISERYFPSHPNSTRFSQQGTQIFEGRGPIRNTFDTVGMKQFDIQKAFKALGVSLIQD